MVTWGPGTGAAGMGRGTARSISTFEGDGGVLTLIVVILSQVHTYVKTANRTPGIYEIIFCQLNLNIHVKHLVG